MGWIDGLLGGLQGLTQNIDSQIKAQQDIQAKKASDRSDFQKEIIKGIVLQSMKPKSQGFNWNDMVDDSSMSAFVDPEFLRRIFSGLKTNRPSGGGSSGKSSGTKTGNPFSSGGGGLNIFGGGASTSGPRRITIQR